MTDVEHIQDLAGFMDGLKPDPIMTVSEWAEKYRILSSVAAAEPGPYRCARTPYLVKIMDCLSSKSPYTKIIFMKSAQVGATEAGINWVGYTISMSPGPMLMVMPTDDTVKRNSKSRIDPMIEDTPIVREKVKPNRSRDSGNTTKSKEFPGGIIYMAGANSAANLRSMPARNLMLDEVDAYPEDLEGEGSPIELARARSRTFSKRKEFITSTPTTEGVSVIAKEFAETDQNWWHVPCPHCAAYQKLTFAQLKWEPGKPETVLYQCVHCDEMIEERHKTKMLAAGEWIPDKPEKSNSDKIGFFINSLYSPLGWFSWKNIIEDFEAAKDNAVKLKAFTNTILAETWKEKGERPEWESIYNKRQNYKRNKPPKDVCFITVGADVQKDRIELEVVGWCKGRRSYSIDFRILPGDTSEKAVWDELAKVVNESWEREDGVLLPMTRMALDTGAYTSYAYDFCRRFDLTKVIPIKGGPDTQAVMIAAPARIDVSQSGKKIGKMKVWRVGGAIYKSELYGWLKLNISETGEIPHGYCHFPEYGPEYFKGLASEQIEVKMVRGYRHYVWVKKYDRNEPLDCRVYARAAATIVGIDRFKDDDYDRMAGASVPKKIKKERPSRGDFWS